MEIKETKFDDARKVFNKLIYDWTFKPATYHQFIDIIDDADKSASYWLQGARCLKNAYDWYWCDKYHYSSNNWDAFSEYFTNKILDVIQDILEDVMKDYGIEKGDDDGKEIEIDFYKYCLNKRLYGDDDINFDMVRYVYEIDFDVVRYVYETDTDLFNRMISEMLNDMGYYNIKFEVKFKG